MVVGCQPYAPAAFTPWKYSWYSFLLEAESTPGPYCFYNGYRVFPMGKERQGRDADPSTHSSAVVKKEKSYTSTCPMGRTACTEPQCPYKSALYLYLFTFPRQRWLRERVLTFRVYVYCMSCFPTVGVIANFRNNIPIKVNAHLENTSGVRTGARAVQE